MFFDKDKRTEDMQEGKTDDIKNTKEDNKIKVKPKMIWVDGYKGTNENMKCRDFQYELGKEFIYDGQIDLCNSGFHACKNLEDVFTYYSLNGKNRFFKIKAFVPENYNENFNKYVVKCDSVGIRTTEFVTSKIQFISECAYNDLKYYITQKYPMIENENEYHDHICNYDIFAKNKFIKKMINFGYSESFATVISNNLNNYENILSYAQAFEDEGISKDLKIYMLIKKTESVNINETQYKNGHYIREE
jgi:hypothetical protein